MIDIDIGLNIKLGTDEQIVIDCGPLIDATEVTNVMVNWIHNSNPLSNGSVHNIVISQNERQCIINGTVLAVGGQLGNGGNYTCEVCSDFNICTSNSSIIDVCGQ